MKRITLIREQDLPPQDHEAFSDLQYHVDKWLGDSSLDTMAWIIDAQPNIERSLADDVAELPSGVHVQFIYGFVKLTKKEVDELKKEAEEYVDS